MRSVAASVVAACVPSWLWCLVGRHEYLQRTAPGHLYLECRHCQHETPGIHVAIR